MKIKNILSIFVLMLSFFPAAGRPSAREINLGEWRLQHSALVRDADAAVSTAGYDDNSWHNVTLPATVLNALVRDSVYPDPRVGMNNYLIPDVSDEFNRRLGLERYSHLGDGKNPWQEPYWYRTEIDVPASWKGELNRLELDGINYRADVWVNGKKIADSDTIVGMFRRFSFDVSRELLPGATNSIAIKIHQVDHPGDPSPGTQWLLFGPNRGNAQDIWRDETLKMSGGWDCAPVVRDRNMGIYHPVRLVSSGMVTFDDPHVETSLPAGDTTLAAVKLTVPLVNHSQKQVKGILKVKIFSPKEIDFVTYKKAQPRLIKPIELKVNVTVPPSDTALVELTPTDYPQLNIKNPPLWWPNGYGEQAMQHIDMTFVPEHGSSTDWSDDFAIREVRHELMPRKYEWLGIEETEYGLVYYVNGRRIYARGGWIQPDILLDNSRRNIYDQSRLLAHAGVNIIGSEDMPAPSEDWLDSWDKYGLMAWHVFHQCYRMFPGRATAGNPDDHSLAAAHVRDEIKRYRNHPSIIAWTAVNEVMVAEDLYNATKQAVKTLDPSRHFIPTTSVSWNVEELTPWIAADMPIGTTDDGAPDYGWMPSDYYFDKIDEVYTQMFKNELGMPAPPVYENLRKFIPTVDKPMDLGDRLWPLDSVWAEHGAWDANNFVYRNFDNAVRTLYSDPVSARDYALKTQILAADGYRAMWEAANSRLNDITTGVMLWKLNSCWPDVAWQIYDWYLTPNAAYYYTKHALEPLHVQLNANTEKISVINATPHAVDQLVVNARITDFFMNEPWSYSDTISIAPETYKELVTVPKGGKLAAVYLVTLTLSDINGNELSRNTYWRYSQHPNFYWLINMPKGKITHTESVRREGDEWVVTADISCDKSGFAIFKHLTLSDSVNGPSVDPVFWSDNFLILLPGETKTVTARVAADLLNAPPILRIDY